ncbi:MAG: hypothetical protein E7261_04540 [Lachnospiraceae bacterium]|nr:hypothetical protein [Lachnospiraceae bacterium]
MGRHYKGTCKQIKISFVVVCVIFIMLTMGIMVSAAEFPRYEEDGYGWKYEDDSWYYINISGTYTKGWLYEADNNWYYFDKESGKMYTGWLDYKGSRFYLTETGAMQTGWMTTDEGTYYFIPASGAMLKGSHIIDGKVCEFGSDGKLVSGEKPPEEAVPDEPEKLITKDASGKFFVNKDGEKLVSQWLEWENGKYYLAEDGTIQIGWMKTEDGTYFFDPDSGAMVTGIAIIDNVQYGFDEAGKLDDSVIPWNLVLVNYANALPDKFSISKSRMNGNHYVDSRIVTSLTDMINAAAAEGVTLKITSAYRTYDTQWRLYQNALHRYMKKGMTYKKARIQTDLYHALPGKSEHNLGLALDFIWGGALNDSFAYSAPGIWLKSHAHEYGFILRYEKDKTDITKIAYEPWHYRYVGVETATEIYNSGVCFEEYFPNYSTK